MIFANSSSFALMSKEQNNEPSLWRAFFPLPSRADNKYDRGYAVIMGGGLASTGATKLAANAALRAGAGLVAVACDKDSLPVYAASFQAIMNKLTENVQDFSALVGDGRVTAVLLGCGCGVNERTKNFTLAALALNKKTVLDADALTVFAGQPEELFLAIKTAAVPCILTPHEGEFARIFPDFMDLSEDRAVSAQKAAKLSGAVVILKGFNTIIAAPDGRVVVNNNATPYLATAGSGDVLAGICVGLLAAGMPAFEAACAGVWLHAEAGGKLGAGLIADDLADTLPEIFKENGLTCGR